MMSLFDAERIMKTYAKDIEKETERKTAERMIKKRKNDIGRNCGLCSVIVI